MTAQPLRHPRSGPGLRVLAGKKVTRPALGPWVVFSLVAIVAFLGMVATRISLDRSSIELAGIERDIADAQTNNQQLRWEIGRMVSPSRIAPLAREMGMIYPDHSERLLVSGVIPEDYSDRRWTESDRLEVTADGPARVVATGIILPQAAAPFDTGDLSGGDAP